MERVETDMYVYCSDSFLLKKLQKLVFVENGQGDLEFSMNQLLPLPSGFSGIPNYQIFGHHWRELMWGVDQDGREFGKHINENDFSIHYTTPWVPGLKWYAIFCEMAEKLHDNWRLSPKPTLVVLYAFGVFDTSYQGYSHWEPGMDLQLNDLFPGESADRLKQFFPSKDIDRFIGNGDTWE